MRPFSLFQPDPSVPDRAYGTLGRAINAGRYRYEGYFETRHDHRASALAALPRLPHALWIDHQDNGGVHRVDGDDLVYEGEILDLLGYPGLMDKSPADSTLRLRFDCANTELVASALREGIVGDSMKVGLHTRLVEGDIIVMTRPSLVRAMIDLVARVNDSRRAEPDADLAVSNVLTGISRYTAGALVGGQIA